MIIIILHLFTSLQTNMNKIMKKIIYNRTLNNEHECKISKIIQTLTLNIFKVKAIFYVLTETSVKLTELNTENKPEKQRFIDQVIVSRVSKL